MHRFIITTCFSFIIAACGDNEKAPNPTPVSGLQCDLDNLSISFRDKNPDENAISGKLTLGFANTQCNADRLIVSHSQGATETQLASISYSSDQATLEITIGSEPLATTDVTIKPFLDAQAGNSITFTMIDLVSASGPGGNVNSHWQYGVDREPLMLAVSRRGNVKYCSYDNGNVLIHDSEFNIYLEARKSNADDITYPAYEFDCTDSTNNTHRQITSINNKLEPYVHTYSTINDAMHYGNISFDMFKKYLGIRPLDKLRIRAHHAPDNSYNISPAYWDGAYVNLNDAIYFAYGMATLDVIAHEMAHGVLQQHTALKHPNDLDVDYTLDGKTLHEAYSDMAAVMAHYNYYNKLNWVMGDENNSAKKRYLDRIETEPGAILSYLDYSTAGSNFYKRMSIMTYPFYLLTNQWGIETSFELFTQSARTCWQPNSNLEDSARCVLETAQKLGLNTNQVIESFRKVKVKLNPEDTFAHYTFEARKFNTQFENKSVTDRATLSYQWNFGDGNTSTQASPLHVYGSSGEYTATLEIEDNLGTKDSITRTFEISDQYCTPDDTPSDSREFTSVEIAGVNIGFDTLEYDYTDQIINVTAGQAISTKIDFNVLGDEGETLWYIWVDLNDNAVYTGVDYHDDDNSEQRLRLAQTSGERSLDSSFIIPEKYAGNTFYMRITADHSFPCHARSGSTFDVKINVLAP